MQSILVGLTFGVVFASLLAGATIYGSVNYDKVPQFVIANVVGFAAVIFAFIAFLYWFYESFESGL